MLRKGIAAISVMLVFALSAWADSEIRIVRLSLVDGPVQLDRATGQGFERAIMNMPITNGMQLWTRDDSRAEIEFEDGNTIRVTPGTKVEFTQLVLRDDGSRATVLTIPAGRVYVNYSHKSGENFRILAGNREIVLDKSVHFRLDVTNDRAELAVLGGDVQIGPLRVKKNNTALLYFSGGNDELAKGVAPALEDRWDSYRSSYHDTYAKAGSNGLRYYGQSDLNYYGSWYDTGYGSCWRPNGFGPAWDPYSSGAWAYYPNYGYTFVSLYQWGWQPYRSGAWNYAGGLGWCWSPGRRYYGLGWAPVYNAPAGYRPAQPPSPVTRVPGTRDGRGLGIVPVGNVNTTDWRPTDPIVVDRDGRGRRGASSTVMSSGVSGGGATSTTTVPSGNAAVTRGSRGDRNLNTAPDASAARGKQTNSGPPLDSADRALQRDMQREQRQIYNQQRSMQGAPSGMQRGPSMPSGDRGYSRVSPAPSAPAPAPRMSPPPAAPAPVRSAPPAAAPSRGDSKGAVPK